MFAQNVGTPSRKSKWHGKHLITLQTLKLDIMNAMMLPFPLKRQKEYLKLCCMDFNKQRIVQKWWWLLLYGISTITGYSIPNPLYTYILTIYNLVWFMAYQLL